MFLFSRLMMVLVLFLNSCGQSESQSQESVSSINEVVKQIQSEAEQIRNEGDQSVRKIDLITQNTNIIKESNDVIVANIEDIVSRQENIREIEDIMMQEEYNEYVVRDTIPKKDPVTSNPNTVTTLNVGSYIKVGNDRSGVNITSTKAEKITVVVMTKGHISLADVYIYAIPVQSHLVRNHNTLIGYVNNLEVVNNQAQFTRFWTGKRSNGTRLRKGRYNIYIEYRYKNHKNVILGMDGRYWGGNHRKWTVNIR